MDPCYAAAYARIARTHWWWRAREGAIVEEVGRLRAGKPPARILDVGCGDGIHFRALARFGDVEGIEADATTLDPDGPNRSRIHVMPFAEPLPLDGGYDVILFLDVLEHLDDPVEALRLARSLLAPDGAVLVTVPALPALWTTHDDLNHHRRRYTRESLRQEFVAAGLRPRRLHYLFQFLVPAKAAVRITERLLRREPAPPGVPPAPINALAAHVARLERRLLRPIASWLPGTSVMGVGATPVTE